MGYKKKFFAVVKSMEWKRNRCSRRDLKVAMSPSVKAMPRRCYRGDIKSNNNRLVTGISVVQSEGKEAGFCYGCGADMTTEGQTGTFSTREKKAGYWAEKSHTLKISKLKNWTLCPRCRKLKDIANESGSYDGTALEPSGEMVGVFRTEVSKIRRQKAVVVLCVDAINVAGTLIRRIRNTVGGNPILLAVTRCDLLPDYVVRENSVEELKHTFAQRASEISPAAVYLCSEEEKHMVQMMGIKELASDLWDGLNGRDLYIVGAANIGKSTLTDILISGFLNRGERSGEFANLMAKKRLKKLRKSRVTKSSLPGTTLQNIRVPCFADHLQGLWDTPGLLLDESVRHFPLRGLKRIRAQRPTQIQPHIIEVAEKSFALLLFEQQDDMPLLRIEVRTKKNDIGDGPIRLVWNSTLPLDAMVVGIKDARETEMRRALNISEHDQARKEQRAKSCATDPMQIFSKEEAFSRMEEKRKANEERFKMEREHLGEELWLKRKKESELRVAEAKRSRVLSTLLEVNEVVIDKGIGMDISIANFGWMGILPPRTTMVKTFAPNSGVRVTSLPTLALPTKWRQHAVPVPLNRKNRMSNTSHDHVDHDGSDSEETYSSESDHDSDFEEDIFQEDCDGIGAISPDRSTEFHYKFQRLLNGDENGENDPWQKFSGQHVGWKYEADASHSTILHQGWNPIQE